MIRLQSCSFGHFFTVEVGRKVTCFSLRDVSTNRRKGNAVRLDRESIFVCLCRTLGVVFEGMH